MTAGDGIIHEEFHSEAFSRSGGLFEMVQLWVNLPAKDKSAKPRYQHLVKADIATVDLAGKGQLRLIAGDYYDEGRDGGTIVKGAAETFVEMNVWDGVIMPKQSIELTIPVEHNLLVVVLRGMAAINDTDKAAAGQLVVFAQEEGVIRLAAGDEEVNFAVVRSAN